MNDVNESVRRFRVELDSAISRGRRARSEARHQCEDFRQHTKELGTGDEGVPAGEQVPAAGGTPARPGAADFRMRTGLSEDPAVDDSGPEESEVAESDDAPNATGRPNGESPQPDAEAESQEQTPSDGSDLDFSQRRMLR